MLNDENDFGRGKKFKKCCGRFNVEELTRSLSALVESALPTDKLIEYSLKMLTQSDVDSRGSYFCLMNPKLGPNSEISWAFFRNSQLSHDDRAAIVMRRMLAGFLPMGWLIADLIHGWRTATDVSWVPSEYRDAYVFVARLGMTLLSETLEGNCGMGYGSDAQC
jgi:hypothetical protein